MVGGTSAVVCADTRGEDAGAEGIEGLEMVHWDFEGAILIAKRVGKTSSPRERVEMSNL